MNSFKSIRVISFKPANQGVIVVAGAKDITVRVTLKAESDNYGHAQMVLDALAAMCEDPEYIKKVTGNSEEDQAADAPQEK